MANYSRNLKLDNAPKFKENIKGLTEHYIKIGVFGESGSKILMIANVNEYGVDIKVTPKMRRYLAVNGLRLKKTTKRIRIPERSFVRKTYDERQAEIRTFVESSLNKLIRFELELNQFWDRIGEFLVSMVKTVLTRLKNPPNHPYTLKNKRPKSNPLINTGRLRNSITFKVERRRAR